MSYIFYLIVYGFLLTAALGLLASWVDRKLTARVQYRVGPPLLQPLIDIIKLSGKETLIPKDSQKMLFLSAPVIGFAGCVLASTLLWMNNINTQNTFIGDIIVLIYLLVIPSLSIMLGGFSSGNLYAGIGASREMKLILSYELPFILSVLAVVIHSHFSIKLGGILNFQSQNGFVIGSYSGALAFLAMLMCVQAKLGLVPFDVAEAETEIISGPLIEYSGAALAIYRLTKNMLLFLLPFFMVILFLGGMRFDGINILYSALKYTGILALIVVIRNTNPRVRIDQAMRFFWGPVTILAVIAVILAIKGL
ncbi:MAG: NADH-quinone oxidoreductase subunit H [Candidatus Omnitrophica bacterium]|nr:NADH-quinone oxidoreductase subunit H [Candidatus Omnitrophota bacterium]